ncbi:hypothetical protein ONE63_004974 [Megalurothrips usitatus]|uniref:SAC domain-containing protein n=1 Tax=Megalurothrips usitatus TaxID=439358 RepID=A0AAV7X1E7_9NEOP|nr:hypothetical protein ONE63_004974 [Megalurothrips usitatus]
MEPGTNARFHHIISTIQKIALYETKARYFLVGSNNSQTKFRVLKIDRMEPRELNVVDDQQVYSREEIQNLLSMIDVGNRNRQGSLGTPFVPVASAFGIVGFVRFLEGYYIILVTKRRHAAMIGHHSIFKVEDTALIYIPNDGVRKAHPDEAHYLKMFQSIDLSSNFYFSYSYDMTHTLQMNLTSPACGIPTPIEFGKKLVKEPDSLDDLFSASSSDPSMNESQKKKFRPLKQYLRHYGIRNSPNKRFVWNAYLLKQVEAILSPDWILHITHGFVSQSNVSIFGWSVYITLIARRSNRYAGTRFLKRGANFEGDVANEVETEQIVHDSGVSSLQHGRFSSFVQMRGSVPGHWSQDITKMVPKPPIGFDLSDPFAETAGKHVNKLLARYGSPIIFLNLVKNKERKKHESQLSAELFTAIKYLNQFLPPRHQIEYVSFDMARKNNEKDVNVMKKLAKIANDAIQRTGIFQNFDPYYQHKSEFILGTPNTIDNCGRLQTGIIRVNCVDCLDRTNTAQFALGKCALGYQLYALGFIQEPKLEFDSDCVRMLENLYEDHGDTLALQYGGSQLVHRIKTYRKTAPWTSQGNDIMQTLSRYYRNTFSDAEKQHTINLFLGLFIPEENKPAIWELPTDYYMHHITTFKKNSKFCRTPLTMWWDKEILDALPRSQDELKRTYMQVAKVHPRDEIVDAYQDYYQPMRFSVLDELFPYKISNSVRDFMPHFTTDYSPFTVRARPGRRSEESTSRGTTMKNPSLTGQSSTSSATSSASSGADSEESDIEEDWGLPSDSHSTPSSKDSVKTTTFEAMFPSMHQVYGMQPETPKQTDMQMLRKYVIIGRNATRPSNTEFLNRHPTSKVFLKKYSPDQLDLSGKPPHVGEDSKHCYKQFVKRGLEGSANISPRDLSTYNLYAMGGTLQARDVRILRYVSCE